MENPIKMDDLGVPLFLETAISRYSCLFYQFLAWFFAVEDGKRIFWGGFYIPSSSVDSSLPSKLIPASLPSLKLTAKAPENRWLEDDPVPFGVRSIFKGYVSFMEGTCFC